MPGDVQAHEAGLGELDRVGQEVGEHLADPKRVEHDDFGQVGSLDDQAQTLFIGSAPHQGGDRRRQRGDVGWRRRDLGPARLQAGEVQHVVDERLQRPGRVDDRRQELLLARGQPRLLQQVGHADNAGKRRAQLMADIGQEPVLDVNGGLGADPGLGQGLQSLDVFGDVKADGDIADRASGVVELRDNGGVDPVEASGLGAIADGPRPGAALRDRAIHLREEGAVVNAGVEDAMIGADQVLAPVAADLAEKVVAVNDVAGDVGAGDDGGAV